MKASLITTFLSVVFLIVSCGEDDGFKNDFYESNYRIGAWISPDKRDTLDFVDSKILIRKGDLYSIEEYLYRIEGENLFIKVPNSSIETQHPILTAENNRVVLGNMYPSIGFVDNSGTFIKE